ncbi:hypothetical protein CHS0354_038728 [Potamilus streckersoni]|uniref:Uncharacterized protein n=1 Tax=Potamilus streckersoni TaxID=2493646 RepID=A0AAE0VVQ0_9BIVA|nr:hypothetical protein CHS0354_038728 [Potamilus streckersoni]
MEQRTKNNRYCRFVDASDELDIFRSKNVNDLRPFYGGSVVDQRMDAIRNSIVHIRQNWDQYESFLSSLKTLMIGNDKQFVDKTLTEKVDRIFKTKKDWKGDVNETDNDNFDVLELYTSEEGYEKFFKVINDVFRKDDSVLADDKIRSAVFLIELINIDLFNYCLKEPSKQNFQGIVYRGMGISKDVFETFEALKRQPIPNRYISIPLALWSTSSDRQVAFRFITNQILTHKGEKIPLLMKIHVIELKPAYLKLYRKTFPSIVVSTICAVDIQNLSFFPKEKEILLRGPFFQVLDLYEEGEICGYPCKVLEMVMLNSNRDHKSTAFLGSLDSPARKMFGDMVVATRSRFAMNYCNKKGLTEDAEEYRKIVEMKENELPQMLEYL